MATTITYEGIVRIRDLPDPSWSEETFKYWWCDEYSASGVLIRRAKMSQREKDRYTILEAHNQIMTAGFTQILTFIGTTTSNTPALAQKLAIGTGTIYTTTASDTTLSTEIFRKTPTGMSVSGNQVDITTNLAAGDAVGTWSNIALFGINATGTANSGTMMTHLLLTFIKDNATARVVDYAITAQ